MGEAEPGLIPEKDQIRLDREAFFHHAARVVDVAVEGAIREIEELDAIETARCLEVEQGLLDDAQRHRAVHGILCERKRFDVVGLHAAQHAAIMVRLVAIPVDDGDIARRQQRLDDHLVACRGAVGHEEDAIRAEGAGGQLLRFLDVSGWLEQAVEATCRGGAFREEQIRLRRTRPCRESSRT